VIEVPGSGSALTPSSPGSASVRQRLVHGRTGRLVAIAVAIHVVTRLVVLAAVVIAEAIHPLGAGSLGNDVGSVLSKSDGVWYLGIAHHGYGHQPPIAPNGQFTTRSSLAFFPLYPLLIRALAAIGLPYLGAALLVTAVAGCLAAAAIFTWARPLIGDRGALLLLVTWELLPSSVSLGMAYSESLFVAAAAGCLLALQRRRWLAAGAAAAVGGLTRPTGGALLVAVVVAAGVELATHRRPDAANGERREPAPAWRLAGATLLAAGGLAVSLIHVGLATHRIDGWFWVERTVWHSGFDGGRTAVRNTFNVVTGAGRASERTPDAIAALAVIGFIALAVWAWRTTRSRDQPSFWFAIAVGFLAIGERNYAYVKPRLLLVGFPILLPVGAWLARQPRRRLLGWAAPAVLVSLVYNTYLLAGWPFAL
jgi:putative Ca2+/H+ antiporter (TMEM165/GDT1 family)